MGETTPPTTEPPPLGLYVHLPWCVRKCPYCDFNSHALRGELPSDDYVDALLRDLDYEAASAEGRPVETVFFGGGTPSLFPAEAIARFMDGLRARVPLAADAEITLEANPGAFEQARFEGFRAAGINRLSIGVQSFHGEQLHALGRVHGAEEALGAVAAARAAGFDNINLDLMYALPGQNRAQALADVEQAIALAPEHLSHYQLTLEPGTAFAARPPRLPDPDEAWAIQEACQARLAEAGYQHYEISAYARPGRRARHNLNYWLFGDYLAVGAGAHGKLSDAGSERITRRTRLRLPRAWQQAAGGPQALAEEREVSREDRVLEFMLNALRLTEGFPRELMLARTGLASEDFAAPLAQARARGWLAIENGHIRPTTEGLNWLNDLQALFLPRQP
ncbi:radical SAM family heme chaperone HemW [Alkalilimnicola sp. S0819]|uniref:radical SAM family heme chaperone HemW n=1 Tax=Alkalilimnicola sp. S0819 TaxID=2613922 RepID=UPI001261956E|nr:radical SAM family heme chaperone HemW [Alkalilimnicola sp. S0819]KAB7624419.1 oxygen-independent coproporphyrinogen III oxidase-like protein [Alkalilimnicola sp. S0819]MPQ16249.1 oxygen-independent coproporphyrinogen III oxidase-like protein [Alkalilimnicola sp. S0819]